MVVSKKISKKAVVRNKIKRRVRHLIKEFNPKAKIVVVVKKDISNIEFKSLYDEFKNLTDKIH